MTTATNTALSVQGLDITLVGGARQVPVVTGASLAVAPQEIVGLVGESGSGKSLTSLALMRLLDPKVARVTSGSVTLFGRELLDLSESAMRAVRGKEIGMIFQDPMTSLDPAFTTGYQLTSILRRHTGLGRAQARRRAVELLGLVGIADPRRRVDQYPHQLSGGMRQRVMIAMAIACEPKVLIADEPTTALDATTQAQILDLIRTLAETMHMSRPRPLPHPHPLAVKRDGPAQVPPGVPGPAPGPPVLVPSKGTGPEGAGHERGPGGRAVGAAAAGTDRGPWSSRSPSSRRKRWRW